MALVAGLDYACCLLSNLHDRTLQSHNRLSPLSRRTIAIKQVLARQHAEEMKPKKITKFVDSPVRDRSVKSILQSQ
jgi:hypothetical protein